MIDATQQLNTVQRTLGTRVLEAGEARVQTITQTYPSDLKDVWDACTNPERIPRWFLPVSGELRLGGRYQLKGNAGGTIERCDPPTSFAATWEYGDEVSWIEVRLAAVTDGTRFELEHVAHVKDEFWTQYGPGATGVGWELGLLGLATHLETGAVVPPETVDWPTTPDGIRFVTECSAAWGAASITAGTDEAAARAAADRTTAFYTATPERA